MPFTHLNLNMSKTLSNNSHSMTVSNTERVRALQSSSESFLKITHAILLSRKIVKSHSNLKSKPYRKSKLKEECICLESDFYKMAPIIASSGSKGKIKSMFLFFPT